MKPNSPLARPAVEWLETARRDLEGQAGISVDPQEMRLALQLLLAHVLDRPRAWVIAHPEAALNGVQAAQFDSLIKRYASGTPLPYLLGRWEFYGLSFIVNPAVLIPRPETELLVDEALRWLGEHPNRRSAADVGTGSGCIAVSMAYHVSDLRVLAVDRSQTALQVARQNAVAHQTEKQILFVQGDLLRCAAGPLDLVCANLPYIPTAALDDLPVARSEPLAALDGGADGLACIRAMIDDAPRWLAPGGLLLLEMQYDQGETTAALLRRRLPDADVTILPDLAGLPRLVRAERGGAERGVRYSP